MLTFVTIHLFLFRGTVGKGDYVIGEMKKNAALWRPRATCPTAAEDILAQQSIFDDSIGGIPVMSRSPETSGTTLQFRATPLWSYWRSCYDIGL